MDRRKFLGTGVAAAATSLVAGTALAQACRKSPTGAQPLGPFFPRPGTPEKPVRENPKAPIHMANDNDLTFVKGHTGSAKGQVVFLKGKVLNEKCQPIEDASVIIWQASASGRYNHAGDRSNHDFEHPKTKKNIRRELDPNFQYWGRDLSGKNGDYGFKTVVPGFYPADINSGWFRPPHIHMMVAATGYQQLVTQAYFAGGRLLGKDWIKELNDKDYLLQSRALTKAEREKLVVEFVYKEPDLVGQFDIILKR